ncbi:MAG: aminotransferase class I/II-fold pyridoxal phosphate-dependent enzyme [Candidatus Gracilibacteria bacterium]
MLPAGMRIMQPTPSYPTHASAEAFHGGSMSIFYNLDPDNDWQPDLGHMEEQIQAHPEVVGLLIINPNNPTGAVYSKETLEAIVQLAEKYSLMLISDEVYFRMVYNGYEYAQLTEVAQGRVPLVVMRGLSKDVPWPGGRCGWMEFHNVDLDPDFKAFVEGVKKRVLMEVCSVSLPQFVLPGIYDHPEYEGWLASNNAELEQNGNAIAEVLGGVKGLKVNRTNGAFYMMPLFEDGVLNDNKRCRLPMMMHVRFWRRRSQKKGCRGSAVCVLCFGVDGDLYRAGEWIFELHAGFRLTILIVIRYDEKTPMRGWHLRWRSIWDQPSAYYPNDLRISRLGALLRRSSFRPSL